jgi:hypothetical protein
MPRQSIVKFRPNKMQTTTIIFNRGFSCDNLKKTDVLYCNIYILITKEIMHATNLYTTKLIFIINNKVQHQLPTLGASWAFTLAFPVHNSFCGWTMLLPSSFLIMSSLERGWKQILKALWKIWSNNTSVLCGQYEQWCGTVCTRGHGVLTNLVFHRYHVLKFHSPGVSAKTFQLLEGHIHHNPDCSSLCCRDKA